MTPLLQEIASYRSRGLDDSAVEGLGTLATLLLSSPVNVTAARSMDQIESRHFLDCLTLLDLPALQSPGVSIVDVGAGGGLPSLVLAVALPNALVTALESISKKCAFLRSAAAELALGNVTIECVRAEEFGQRSGRGRYDVAVSRAVGTLGLVAELSVPLLPEGGLFVAMKGRLDARERAIGLAALGILGVDEVEERRVYPFPDAEHRRLVVGKKIRSTPAVYPRPAGVMAKRPLGVAGTRSEDE